MYKMGSWKFLTYGALEFADLWGLSVTVAAFLLQLHLESTIKWH